MNLDLLNFSCIKRAKDYQNLLIGGQTVVCPYFINTIETYFQKCMSEADISEESMHKAIKFYRSKKLPYAWYRGKGSPEQIASAANIILPEMGFDPKRMPVSAIRDCMMLRGLGVDCSGFVYTVLSDAVKLSKHKNSFNKSLDWSDDSKTGVTRAGCFVFAGDASVLIKPENLRPLDIVLIKKKSNNSYAHIALILADENNELMTVQSSIGGKFHGVRSDVFCIRKKGPYFSYEPWLGYSWKSMYENGSMEFRRLNEFSNYE